MHYGHGGEVVPVVRTVFAFSKVEVLFFGLGCQGCWQAVEIYLIGRQCPQAGVRTIVAVRFHRFASWRVERTGGRGLHDQSTDGSEKHMEEERGRTQRQAWQRSCPRHPVAGENPGIVHTEYEPQEISLRGGTRRANKP
jgi:nucleosome binding factor SPN SPT16 subunit